MSRVTHTLAWSILGLNLLALAVAMFWMLYPYNVITVAEPIPILNPNHTIAIGEPIQMYLEISKQIDTTPQVTGFITCDDGNLVTMNATNKSLPVGDYAIISESFLLPPKVLVGAECQFNFHNEYTVNPLRTIFQKWVSETFTVKGE